MTPRSSDLSIAIKPMGGIAGDMFAGACAALWPDLCAPCLTDVRAAGLPAAVPVSFESVIVNGFAARHFRVGPVTQAVVPTGDYRLIVERLEGSALDREVLAVALAILRVLGEAEARVHGKPLDQVHFHELADWDSVADIVAAASFVARSGAKRWAVGPLPLGGGTVETQHGTITVPAPAVLEMLDGYRWSDDGIPGERVTPTGAAIVRYLAEPEAPPATGALVRAGFGAGTRRYPSMANVVQLVAFEGGVTGTETIAQLAFDIDDMTPEELAHATDRLRAEPGVLDVTQTAQIGKKGRAMFLIRVLAARGAADAVADACFAQTSTLGVRIAEVRRRVLERRQGCGPKIARRPDGGLTAKAESDGLAGHPTLDARRAAAHAAEQAALKGESGND